MTVFLSFLPVLSTVAALIFGMRPLWAALIGLLAALVAIAATTTQPPLHLLVAILGWLPVLAEVLLIVGGGLLLSQVLRLSGAQAAIADWLVARGRPAPAAAPGPGLGAVLLVVHGVTPFAESLTGFGIGVTVGIPLLLHFGLSRAKAAAVGLLGLCAVPWGSMAPGTLIAATMAGLPFRDLGLASAVLSILPFAATGMIAGWIVQPGLRALMMGAVSGLGLTLAVSLANAVFGTAPAGAVGSLVLILVHLARGGRAPLSPIGRRGILAYAVLLGGVLVAGGALQIIGAAEAWRYLASPALWLFLAVLWFSGGLPELGALQGASRSWCSVAPVTGAFILLGVVMSASGMAVRLAEWLAGSGAIYPFFAPFVAAAGGFITGSNTGANAMLAATQAEIARQLGVNVLWYMAAHNVAAAFLLMASPGKVEMAVQLAEAGQDRKAVQILMLKVAALVVALLSLTGGLAALWA